MTFRLWAIVICLLAFTACSDRGEPEVDMAALVERMDILAQFAARASDEGQSPEVLTVRLAFEGTVDLDLYVTDPRSETVYFANQKAKSGGVIAEDARCENQGVKIEEVSFKLPPVGKYRVGIDYPEHCSGKTSLAVHAVHVSYGDGELAKQGTVELEKFEVVVVEFDFDGSAIREIEEQ